MKQPNSPTLKSRRLLALSALLLAACVQFARAQSWQATGPESVTSLNYGAVTGRVTALALDPADATGNSLYIGATGGGVWHSINAASAAPGNITFTQLTDVLSVMQTTTVCGQSVPVALPSISIGALTVQPGATGVLLAGTGDPNDAYDSYYGDGILYSASDGTTWNLLTHSCDLAINASTQNYYFTGEAIAGFAWSGKYPQYVVAAVTQSYRGYLDSATMPSYSYEGIYYSSDGGADWYLSTIEDSTSSYVQGPLVIYAAPDGNAVTSIVWNPVRQLFLAAVRYHGYYSSPDGITWTRLANQPGANLTQLNCPTNTGVGSNSLSAYQSCPIFRGALAVNPATGDTFAWTVDINLQDQGIWQDQCNLTSGACANLTIAFGKQINTTALEVNTSYGAQTISSGDYTLTLAAVPNQQDTELFAGGTDLWQCSIYNGCVWRNTTNAYSCMSAQVAAYQHSLAWNPSNSAELFIGNDGGLWRSTDRVGETGSACNSTDNTHFQNLNSGFGSIAEAGSLSVASSTANTLLAGLGTLGAAGVKGTVTPPSLWPEVLGGYGGTVFIDPTNNQNWYVNNQTGVNINLCSSTGACTNTGFGSGPVVTEADVSDDGYVMWSPAAFMSDPLDNTQLLVATCRIWRGPVNGTAWNSSNAISGMLDGTANSSCNGDAIVRSLASQTISGGTSEVLYAGMYGENSNPSNLPGHLFSATYNPASNIPPTWTDLAANPVTNSGYAFNTAGFDVTGIYIDSHDPTGNTVYVTLGGVPSAATGGTAIYRSTSGGAQWQSIQSNLPLVPINAVAVDPQNANVVYVANDYTVYFTSSISTCAAANSNCWVPYGSGLPTTPVAQLIATPLGATPQILTAGTYGRGIWQAPLYTSGTTLTTATLTPSAINFANQVENVPSAATVVTLKNTGSVALTPSLILMTGNFSETDNCVGQTINPNSTCTINVVFTPASVGALSGSMTVSANVSGGQLGIPLSGTGIAPGNMTLAPGSYNYGNVQVGQYSPPESFSLTNSGGASVSISSVGATAPFSVSSNSCGSSLAANSACSILVVLKPTAAGAANGTLTVTGSAGTQTANLSGTGLTAATATLSFTKYTFPLTAINTASAPVTLTLTNSGQEPLTGISGYVSNYFSVTSNCGTTLPGNSSCSFFLVFTPLTIVSNYTQTLYIYSSLGQQTVTLTGTGVADPVLAFQKAGNNYHNQEEGTTSAPFNFALRNEGQVPISGITYTITGQGASSFSIVPDGTITCGSTLFGADCGLGVVFDPQSVGAIQATVVATATSPITQSTSLLVYGIGIAPPILSVNPTSLTFGAVGEGTTSVSQQTYVKNIGATTLTDMQWSITSGASYFSLPSGSNCTATLKPANYCHIYLAYSPTSISAVYGTLTISSVSNATPPVTVSLLGTGTPPATITTSAPELDFGNQTTGQSSSPLTLTVFANGASAIGGLGFALSGSGGFTLRAGTCGTSLPINGTCTELVSFAPSQAGFQTATLTISSTTPYVPSTTVLLTGTGVPPAIIQPSPLQLNFGSVLIGQTSATSLVTITNSGGSALTSLVLQGAVSFPLVQNNCPATLNAGSSCQAGLAFTPTQSGPINGNLSISTNTPGSSNATVPLTGNGLKPGSLTLAPTTFNFGNLPLDQSSVPQPFTLFNSGGIPVSGLTFTTTGNFSISGQTTCGATLSSGATCTIYVVFTPASVGSLSGQLQIASTTQGVPNIYAGLTGTGLSTAYLVATPTQLNFSNTAVNTTSTAMTFLLSNTGSVADNGLNFQSTSNFSNSHSSCPSSLAPGASCTVSVYFSPFQAGALTGTVQVTSSTPAVAPAMVSLTGTATAPASLSLNPNTLSFPNTVVSTTSAPMSITVTNPGTAPLATPSLAMIGDFQIQSNSCTQALAAGASCTATLVFTPTVLGGRSGFITVSSSTTGVNSVFAPLSGTSVSPAQLGTSVQSITFPNLAPGQISAPQSITITVAGGAGVTNLQAAADPGFVVTQNTCAGTLQSGATCAISVAFAPAVVGNYVGQLTISGTGAQYPVSVGLTGAAYAPPSLQSSSGQISFQTTGVGTTSAPTTIQLTNTSPNVDITGLQLIVQGDQSFQLSGTTCAATLPAGTSCTASVTYTPSAAGPAQPAWLVAVSANATGPLAIPLYGIGLNFTFEATGQTTLTVASGQTAFYNFTITIPATQPPTGNLQAVFTLSCGSLPQNTVCQFIPQNCQSNCQTMTTITASQQSPGYATLSLLTGTTPPPQQDPAHSTAALALLLLVPLVFYKRRRLLLPLFLLAAILSSMTSCTASRLMGTPGPGGGGGSANTPPGTYTIQVNAATDGLTQQTTVTVTVD